MLLGLARALNALLAPEFDLHGVTSRVTLPLLLVHRPVDFAHEALHVLGAADQVLGDADGEAQGVTLHFEAILARPRLERCPAMLDVRTKSLFFPGSTKPARTRPLPYGRCGYARRG